MIAHHVVQINYMLRTGFHRISDSSYYSYINTFKHTNIDIILKWSCKKYTQITHKELEILICLCANRSSMVTQQSIKAKVATNVPLKR